MTVSHSVCKRVSFECLKNGNIKRHTECHTLKWFGSFIGLHIRWLFVHVTLFSFHAVTTATDVLVWRGVSRVSIYMLLFISTDINEWDPFHWFTVCYPAIHPPSIYRQHNSLTHMCVCSYCTYRWNCEFGGTSRTAQHLCNLTYMLALCTYIMLN